MDPLGFQAVAEICGNKCSKINEGIQRDLYPHPVGTVSSVEMDGNNRKVKLFMALYK